jgi:hypothetical protein
MTNRNQWGLKANAPSAVSRLSPDGTWGPKAVTGALLAVTGALPATAASGYQR